MNDLEPLTLDLIKTLPHSERSAALRRYKAWVVEQRKKDRAAVRAFYQRVERKVNPERRKFENEYQKKRYATDPEHRAKVLARSREWAKKHPERIREIQRAHRLRKKQLEASK